jgi:hypothetical protein
MVELTDDSGDIGRLDIAANTSDGLVTIRENRPRQNERELEIVVTNKDRTECECIVVELDQFSVSSVETGDEVSDER